MESRHRAAPDAFLFSIFPTAPPYTAHNPSATDSLFCRLLGTFAALADGRTDPKAQNNAQ